MGSEGRKPLRAAGGGRSLSHPGHQGKEGTRERGEGVRKGAAAWWRRSGSRSWLAAWPLPSPDMTTQQAWLLATWQWPWHMTPGPAGEGVERSPLSGCWLPPPVIRPFPGPQVGLLLSQRHALDSCHLPGGPGAGRGNPIARSHETLGSGLTLPEHQGPLELDWPSLSFFKQEAGSVTPHAHCTQLLQSNEGSTQVQVSCVGHSNGKCLAVRWVSTTLYHSHPRQQGARCWGPVQNAPGEIRPSQRFPY